MRLDLVGKRYGLRYPWVLQRISLEIPPGRLVRFEGRNGSGKSTLLRIIAGVAEPTRGSVTGRPVTGYVPERFPPALPFPAREYLSHIGRMHGLDGRTLRSRIDECLDRVGGRELAPVLLRTMSKGMSQKVAVAQALLPGRGLLVLDEAWTGLDVQAKAALDDVVAERVAAGGSVVFVDHEPARLAGLEAQRWRLEGAAISVGVGASVAAGEVAEGRTSAAAAVTIIEVTGLPAAIIAAGNQHPGVLSVTRDGDRFVIRCERSAADGMLGRLLSAADGVHVIRVETEPAGERRASAGVLAQAAEGEEQSESAAGGVAEQ